jgi:hypothetical protein
MAYVPGRQWQSTRPGLKPSNAARGIATNRTKKTGRASIATTITRVYE